MNAIQETMLRAANIATKKPELDGKMRSVIREMLKVKYPDVDSEELERMTTNTVRNGPYNI